MTYHGTAGKLLGLGAATAEFPINDQSVAYAAAMSCEAWAGVTNLNATLVQLLVASFLGTPPPGVSQSVFDAFTLRAIQCNLYDIPGSPEADAWIRAAFPLPSCLDDATIGIIMYGSKYGWKGSDATKNAAVWLMSKSPNNMYLYDLTHIPPCEKGCHNRYHMELVLRCMLDPVDSICASTPALQAWYDTHRDLRLCPTLRGQIQTVIDGTDCGNFDADLSYCAQHGYKGPEPLQNAYCWELWAAQRLQPTIDRCAPAPAPAPAAEPVTATTETTSAPLFPAPTTTATEPAPTEITPTPVLLPPEAVPQVQPTLWPAPPPPPPEKKMSTATLGILGVLGVAVVGGIVVAAKKKKGG
jgi:hypothetical protein